MSQTIIHVEIAGRRCAFRAEQVHTVIEFAEITRVPRAPHFVVGLTALRSQALTVLDSRALVGETPQDFPTDKRGAVIELDGHSYALQIDCIFDVSEMLSDPEHISGGFGANWENFAIGMVETESGPVLLLDAARLIAACGPSSIAA